MRFDPASYYRQVAEILALDGNGCRLPSLVAGPPTSEAAVERLRTAAPETLFPHARQPQGAMAGLWLYFSCFDQAHSIAQDVPGPEGSFWHGILHRQEPDSENAAYWFRRTGRHVIFPALRDAAAEELANTPARTGFRLGSEWDPFGFIEFCELARQRPGSPEERLARAITLAEWQLLFHHCATPAQL